MLLSKLIRNIPEFQKLILVEGFIDSITVFLMNKENQDVSKIFAIIAFHTTQGQLELKASEKIVRALTVLLSKTEGELFYISLKALRRNLKYASSSILLKIIDKLFILWRYFNK